MLTLLLTAMVPALIGMAGCDRAAAQVQANLTQRAADVGGGTASALRARIAPPHDETVAAYRQSGAVNASAHQLTDREWTLVERAIADLPPLHRDVLERRLARLSFIDAPSSAGTALTRAYDGPDGGPLFDITLRADVLDKSLSEFLTEKESMLFTDDGSGYSVRLSAGRAPALTYLLLHEATHVVDRTLGVSTDVRPFSALWVDYRDLAAPYATGPMGVTTYRRGRPIPLAESPELYKALGASPFVSLYATASAGEDLAELAAWSHLGRLHIPLTVEVRDATGRAIVTVEPLRSPAVQARFAVADAVLARAAAKPSQTP
ncbi:hypothetical protein [Melittangium boletus]|uniref:Lipoprotein n=1 Tax=Melittangium boletus DSM 14713 TaxID=1294270 RepID=A0A250IP61_9BACT|nr:hypothetical protein [Melittangium boletus]ATB33032.1 hypothetical protein MEBOL_006521 [Melittangium boletus DSM 14713]